MVPMLTVDARLKSFTQRTRSWPHPNTFKASPLLLAESGFYWKPSQDSPDNVVCFLCGKSLDGWTEDDDPFDEHLSHSKGCGLAICKSVYADEGELPFRWDDEDNLPKGARMTKARLQTFGKWWPHERTKGWFGTSKRMARAGFIYAPTDDSDDNVQCPYCEMALDGWEIEDDPVHEHQRRQPNCAFFATRSTAPTKSSAAKATKQKRKTKSNATDDISAVKVEQDAEPATERAEASKKSKSSIRSQKSTKSQPSSGRPSNATTVSIASKSSTSSRALTSVSRPPSAMKNTANETISTSSPGRTVDFALPGSSTSTSKPGSQRQSTDSAKEPPRRRSLRIKVEEVEQSASSILSQESTGSTSTPSSRLSTRSTQSERKGNQSGDMDSADTGLVTAPMFSYLAKPPAKPPAKQRKQKDIAIVLKKRRKQTADGNEASQDTWGHMSDVESDAPTEDTGGNQDVRDVDVTPTLAAPSSPEEAQQPRKPKRRTKRVKLEEDNDDDYEGTSTKPRKKASTRGTKRKAKSSSSSSSFKKRATKPLIEIFELPDGDVNMEQEGASATTATTATTIDKQGTSAGTSTPSSPSENAILPTTEGIQEVQEVQEGQAIQQILPSTPPPVAPSSLKTLTRGQDPDFTFRQSHGSANASHVPTDLPSTPARKQAVTFEDIEDANVIVVDPSTPVRRAASRTDIEGWEDEDRRDSSSSALTSPFISPSQWHLDSTLSTSTPKTRRTPAQPFLGITPRQRIKDVVGTAQHKSPMRSSHIDKLSRSQLASSSPKKAARSQQIPPEMKQNMLIDRLENLMHENASSEVMVVAEHALKEEVKKLRRSQNKERRQTEALAAAAAALELTEGNALFEDPGLQEFEADSDEDDHNDSDNAMRTPVKKTARVLFESTTPATPNKTPLPVSRVLTAIGAASRKAAQANQRVTAGSDFDASYTTSVRKDNQPQQQQQHQRGLDTTKPRRLHADPEEHKRRTKLLEEANFSEAELRMTVEEFHRACVAEQVLALEVAAEAWVQRFEEESNRVRRALLDDGGGMSG
ncbi:hypothetical protein BGX29_009915 [Mortierella sp. GBA35]|nr:hypothetical protein BGX29_009915 [Mortierella sp. GBA35]